MHSERIIFVLAAAATLFSCKTEDVVADCTNRHPVGTEPFVNAYSETVDLGLSVKWASCNLGALGPSDAGDYFAWGETSGHYRDGEPQMDNVTWKPMQIGYFWQNYEFCDSDGALSKYCSDSGFGIVDCKLLLEDGDDAANLHLGEDWRIPTERDWAELSDTEKCSWTWTSLNGAPGYLVNSKVKGFEGNSIFLPAGGERTGNAIIGYGVCGSYWSSILYVKYPKHAWSVDFSEDCYYRIHSDRSYGRTIRPVKGLAAEAPEMPEVPSEIGVSVNNEGFE